MGPEEQAEQGSSSHRSPERSCCVTIRTPYLFLPVRQASKEEFSTSAALLLCSHVKKEDAGRLGPCHVVVFKTHTHTHVRGQSQSVDNNSLNIYSYETTHMGYS